MINQLRWGAEFPQTYPNEFLERNKPLRFFTRRMFGVIVSARIKSWTKRYITLEANHGGAFWKERITYDEILYYANCNLQPFRLAPWFALN